MWWKKLCIHTHEQIHSRRHARTHAYHGIKYQYVNSALHWIFVDGVTRLKWRQNLSTLDEPCSTDTHSHSHSHRGPERPTDRPTNLNNRIKCSLSIFCVCTLYLLWWRYASVSDVRRCSFFLFFFFVFFDFVFHSRSRSRSRFCHFNSFESSGCCCCLCLVRWYDSAFTLAGSISATSRSFRRRSSLPCTVTFMFDWLSGGSVRGAYSIVPFNFYAFFYPFNWLYWHWIALLCAVLWVWVWVCVHVRVYRPLANWPKIIFPLITQFHFMWFVCKCIWTLSFMLLYAFH